MAHISHITRKPVEPACSATETSQNLENFDMACNAIETANLKGAEENLGLKLEFPPWMYILSFSLSCKEEVS